MRSPSPHPAIRRPARTAPHSLLCALVVLTLVFVPFAFPASATHGDTFCTLSNPNGSAYCTFRCHVGDRVIIVATPTGGGPLWSQAECGGARAVVYCVNPCEDVSWDRSTADTVGWCNLPEGTGTVTCRAGMGSTACTDGLDNDGDGATDVGEDPGCPYTADNDERGDAQCDDGVDNDGDGRVDARADPGCESLGDVSERGGILCDDGVDDDGDGATDYPADPGCAGPDDDSERGTLTCDDGVDNDGDGVADAPADPGCTGPTDVSEQGVAACDDGADNDRDGNVDYPNDPGCSGPADTSEGATCPQTVPGVVLCLEPGSERLSVPLEALDPGAGDPRFIVGYVELYQFRVGSVAATLPCVRLVVDGAGPNACAAAGSAYVSTVAELQAPVREPTNTDQGTVRVCNAELTATALGIGIDSAPALAPC